MPITAHRAIAGEGSVPTAGVDGVGIGGGHQAAVAAGWRAARHSSNPHHTWAPPKKTADKAPAMGTNGPANPRNNGPLTASTIPGVRSKTADLTAANPSSDSP